MRRVIDPPLNRLGATLARRGWRANQVTVAGAALALALTAAIALGWFWCAVLLLALNRFADGLDGAIARASTRTDYGGLLDIACDFVFYAGVPLGFALLDPARNALPAAVLLGSFYLNAASFLGFALLAEKRGMKTDIRGQKSLYFTTGLAEGTETIAVFVVMLLAPVWFGGLAYGFALLCLVTCLARMVLARRVFAGDKR